MINIYEHQKYRAILKAALTDLKSQFGRPFSYERMANACRIQRTYLSAVLAGKGHLSSDQVYMACRFLKFKDDEYRYTSLLHEFERSVFPERRSRLREEIERFKSENLRTESHLGVQIVPTSAALDEFFLNFDAQLVHMFLTVTRFRKNPQLIQQALNISSMALQNSMTLLESAGLIQKVDGGVRVIRDSFHLPASSFLYPSHRMQMRLRSLNRIETQKSDKNYSFSVLFSSSEKSRERIQTKFLKFIESVRQESQDEMSEDVFQLNFDLLKWSDID